MKLPSGSNLGRAIACQDSELVRPVVIEETTEDATRGDVLHDFIWSIGEGATREEALAKLPADDPHLQACEEFDTKAIPSGGHFEIAMAWNFRTRNGRALGYKLDRDYSAADRSVEFVMSLDYAAETRPRHGVVVDWKSGWRTIPARASWQLRAGAVACADTWGWETVDVAHLDIRDSERPRWDVHPMDAIELASARVRLQEYAERRAITPDGTQPERLVEGDHCRYCPGRKACPAKLGNTRALVTALDTLPRSFEAMTQERAQRAVLALLRYDEARDAAWAELEAYAVQEPIDLGDGRVLRLAPGRSADKIVDTGRAIEEVSEVLGERFGHMAVTTSKGAIEAAAAAYARESGLLIGQTKELVIETLRRKGLIEKRPGRESVQIIKTDKPNLLP